MARGIAQAERERRWRLVLGGDGTEGDVALSAEDARIDRALSMLYGASGSGGRAVGACRWVGDPGAGSMTVNTRSFWYGFST